jgi:hypothetical protein
VLIPCGIDTATDVRDVIADPVVLEALIDDFTVAVGRYVHAASPALARQIEKEEEQRVSLQSAANTN